VALDEIRWNDCTVAYNAERPEQEYQVFDRRNELYEEFPFGDFERDEIEKMVSQEDK
jgi:hypothetical protein